MYATADSLDFAPPPPPGVARAFAIAVVAHLLLAGALTWGVNWKRQSETLAVEAELWASVPQTAAPREVVAPPQPPAPVVAPPAVPEKAIVIERTKPVDKPRESKPAPPPPDKARLDEARRAEEARKDELQRQENVKRMAGLARATGAPGSAGYAEQSAGPSAGYGGKIIAQIKANTVYNLSGAGNPTVVVFVRTSPAGLILSRKVVKPSGNTAWDDAVLRALDKMQSVPADVDGRVPPLLVREGLELKVTL